MNLAQQRKQNLAAVKKYQAKNPDKVQEWNRTYLRKLHVRRMEVFNLLKTTAGCADCGFDTHPEALQFDHLSDKKFDLARYRTSSWQLLFGEIEKCDVVCANHHAIRTHGRRRACR